MVSLTDAKMRWRAALYTGMVLALVLLIGCGDGLGGRDAPDERVAERGPLSVTASLDRNDITTAETFHLTIRAECEEGYAARFSKAKLDRGEKLGEFTVLHVDAPAPTLVGENRVAAVRTVRLEPFLPGAHEVPPVTVLFEKEGQEPSKLESKPLGVTVRSVLPADTEGEAALDMKAIAGPVVPPRGLRPWLYALVVILILALACAAFYYWWSRRPECVLAGPPPRPAHEVALEELEALLAEGLIEKGEIKRFHIRVSGILRHYLENRFGLRAPERTTEEFLGDVGTSDVFSDGHRAQLGAFLSQCDLVKFAKHRPEEAENRRAFDTCKDFILDLEAAHPAPGTAGG